MFSFQPKQIFGSKVRVDSTAKVAELELAEKVVYTILYTDTQSAV